MNPAENTNISGAKRKSRFENDASNSAAASELPDAKRVQLDISAAAAKAAELSKSIAARVSKFNNSTNFQIISN